MIADHVNDYKKIKEIEEESSGASLSSDSILLDASLTDDEVEA